MTNAQAIAKLMNRYDEWQAKWIKANGNTDGFDAWFTDQVFHPRSE